MLIYAAMVVVALQSMSPSRQGIHVEAYCARLVVEGCDVPMQNHSGGQQSNRVLHEEDGRSLPTQLTRDLVERREEKTKLVRERLISLETEMMRIMKTNMRATALDGP